MNAKLMLTAMTLVAGLGAALPAKADGMRDHGNPRNEVRQDNRPNENRDGRQFNKFDGRIEMQRGHVEDRFHNEWDRHDDHNRFDREHNGFRGVLPVFGERHGC